MAIIETEYTRWSTNMVHRIEEAKIGAVLSVNQHLLSLYHSIGTEILRMQREKGWGAQVITRLSADLRKAFPDDR